MLAMAPRRHRIALYASLLTLLLGVVNAQASTCVQPYGVAACCPEFTVSAGYDSVLRDNCDLIP
jgi:hypothetical protein